MNGQFIQYISSQVPINEKIILLFMHIHKIKIKHARIDDNPLHISTEILASASA